MFSRIIIGTAQFGLDYGVSNINGIIKFSEVQSILDLANKSGIRSIDTATSYGDAESILGEIGISEFKVYTKLQMVPLDNLEISRWIENEIQSSLTRLKTSQLYGVLLHRPQQLDSKWGQEIIRSLAKLKETKVIKKIGISIYSPIELFSILNKFEVDIVQAPLSVVDNRLERDGWIEKLHNLGIEVHARSIFLQGLLLMNKGEIPAIFKPWESTLNQWYEWLAQNPETNAVQACLSYVCNNTNIDKIIVGIDNLKQFKELVDIIENPVNIVFPNIFINDEKLLHPSNWNSL